MALSGKILFDRRCRLTVASPVDTPNDFIHTTTDILQIEGGRASSESAGMRIKFKIDKSLEKQPNTSEITVSNLEDGRRKALQRKNVKVLLEAGYAETGLTRYFSGDVRTLDHVYNKATWESVFKLGDGERAWKYAQISESFAPGTRAADALRTLANAMGIELGNVENQLNGIAAVFDQGWVAAGSAARELDRMVTSLRKEWSIQDGALQILDPYAALDLPVPEITPDTGLVGSPEMGSPPTKGKPQLLRFKALLFHVKPGGKVKLRSERYDGFVRVHKVSFEGDTHGGDWYTTIDATISR